MITPRSDIPPGRSFCGTGHRPDKLAFGYTDYGHRILVEFVKEMLTQLQPRGVITGMALGYDTALAAAALDLNIPFVAALPFAGQELRWSHDAQQRYHSLLEKAAKVVTVSRGGFSGEAMQRRNAWMVDKSEAVLSLWNGSASGTRQTVTYAQSLQKPVANLWDEYANFAGERHGLFNVPAQFRVNTTNLDPGGVMGAGIALIFAQKYAQMRADYARAVRAEEVGIGRLHVWTAPNGERVINVPTKVAWRLPSKIEYVRAGLDALRAYLSGQGKVTVAIPALGCGRGGLRWNNVKPLMIERLTGLPATIYIYGPSRMCEVVL